MTNEEFKNSFWGKFEEYVFRFYGKDSMKLENKEWEEAYHGFMKRLAWKKFNKKEKGI